MNARRITTSVTLVVLVVVLAAMAAYGYKSATAPLPSSPTSAPTCSSAGNQVQRFLARSQVQVSVFNAGGRSGLASSSLDQLEALGFRPGNAGNAPENVRRAEVWTTQEDDSAAQLVARSLGRRTPVRVTEQDLGPGVDVLVGRRFGGPDPRAPRRIKLAAPVKTCVEVGG